MITMYSRHERKTAAFRGLVAIIFTAMATPALAEMSPEPLERTAPADATPETQLTYLMMNDEKAHMTALRTELAKANSAGNEARADRLNARIDDLAADYRQEQSAIREQIEMLSDEQLTHLVGALGAVEELGVSLDIDAAALKRVHKERYDQSQIEQLIAVYEQTQELSRKAARLTVEAEATGKDSLLQEAQEAAAQAEERREELIDSGQDL